MQRRAALARALLPANPRSAAAGRAADLADSTRAERLRARLAAFWQAQKPTVIMVTHDFVDAVALSSRVIALSPESGRIALIARSPCLIRGG